MQEFGTIKIQKPSLKLLYVEVNSAISKGSANLETTRPIVADNTKGRFQFCRDDIHAPFKIPLFYKFIFLLSKVAVKCDERAKPYRSERERPFDQFYAQW